MPNNNYISMIKGKTYHLNLGDNSHIKTKIENDANDQNEGIDQLTHMRKEVYKYI
jgi:hypothetical protein